VKTTATRIHAAVLALCAAAALPAAAANIETANPDLQIRWDTTLKWSGAYRLNDADAALLVSPNHDDGDRNFRKGLISNRADVFTEFDLSLAGKAGLRLSGAGWYDAVYNRSNANPGFAGGAFPNTLGVPNEFTVDTRRQHGRNAELLDAFVFGKANFDGATLSGRVGKHSILWGESLFFGANAIAGGQQPVDVVKLLSVPGTQFKEAIRPVPQVSAQLQLSPGLSIGAYYQFEWTRTIAPAVGSYFSDVDLVIAGAQQLLLPPPMSAPRLPDTTPPNSGQGGLQLRWRTGETDWGAYAIRFHNKAPQVVPVVGFLVPPPTPVVGPIGFRQIYHEGIQAFGLSASHTFDEVNLGVEASTRHNQDLASTRGSDASALGAPGLSPDNPGYAVGNTAHLNISAVANLPANPAFREGTLMAEVAWNRVLSITKGAAAIDPNATRDAVALRVMLEPKYRQVLPGLDLGLPMGFSWGPAGSRSMALGPVPMPANGHGDLSLGVNGSYLDAWRFSLSWTHFYGAEGTLQQGSNFTDYSYRQSLKDRDFIAASLNRSF